MSSFGEMSRKNWLIVAIGFAVFIMGFVFLSFVGRDYHGFKGFIAPFFLIGGLGGIITGMVVSPDSRKH